MAFTQDGDARPSSSKSRSSGVVRGHKVWMSTQKLICVCGGGGGFSFSPRPDPPLLGQMPIMKLDVNVLVKAQNLQLPCASAAPTLPGRGGGVHCTNTLSFMLVLCHVHTRRLAHEAPRQSITLQPGRMPVLNYSFI